MVESMGWVRRHWLALLGAFFLIPNVVKFLKWLLGLGGDFDFIISRYQDPEWIGAISSGFEPPDGRSCR